MTAIQSFLEQNSSTGSAIPPFSAAPTNYVYLPLDDDFMQPIPDLLSYIETWNNSSETADVEAIEASYDTFVSLVLGAGSSLKGLNYNGTPYYTGAYATGRH